MNYKKLNAHTWVINDGKNTVAEYLAQTQPKSENFLKEKKNRRPKEQLILYEKFVKKVFEERKFISQKEFHKLIKKSFSNCPSFYRKRMRELELITEKNGLIKPKI